jgi:hypothetical protein
LEEGQCAHEWRWRSSRWLWYRWTRELRDPWYR